MNGIKFRKTLIGLVYNIAQSLHYMAVKDDPATRDDDTVNPTPPPPPPPPPNDD